MSDVVTLSYASVGAARADFKTVLDGSEVGRPVTIRREGYLAAVVSAEHLRELLVRSVPAHAKIGVDSDGRILAVLEGRPFYGSGATVDEAIQDVIDALREYAVEWHAELRLAPNHVDQWDLVNLVDLSTDAQLQAWLGA